MTLLICRKILTGEQCSPQLVEKPKNEQKINFVGVDAYIDPQTNNVINGLMWASAPTGEI